MAEFTDLADLASERLGGKVLWATDEFFAPKENLLNPAPPVSLPGKYVETGLWMDGWETRRHRAPDHDRCIIRLGLPGVIRGIVVDTAHFLGNYPEQCSLDASADQQNWVELLPPSKLRGNARNLFPIRDPYRYSHLRFHIYPDGGVARLRVHGDAIPATLGDSIDLAAIENGGAVLQASDNFFGPPHDLIYPGRPAGMFDGWQTRRRRGPGHDWAVIQLGAHGVIHRVEVDTLHFKGNFPESCSLETDEGREVLPQTRLLADQNHIFEKELTQADTGRVRFRVYPDGGVGRLRIFGTPTAIGRSSHQLRLVNSLPPPQALATFLACGRRPWADAMISTRPFASTAALEWAAEQYWNRFCGSDSYAAAKARLERIGISE